MQSSLVVQGVHSEAHSSQKNQLLEHPLQPSTPQASHASWAQVSPLQVLAVMFDCSPPSATVDVSDDDPAELPPKLFSELERKLRVRSPQPTIPMLPTVVRIARKRPHRAAVFERFTDRCSPSLSVYRVRFGSADATRQRVFLVRTPGRGDDGPFAITLPFCSPVRTKGMDACRASGEGTMSKNGFSMASVGRKRNDTPLRVVPGGARPREYSDEQIVHAVRQGDTAVADELYARLVDSVDITLYRIFGRREPDHEDLIQKSFEQIVITLCRRSYAGACSLRTWASAVTSRVAFNVLRSRRRERAIVDHGAADVMDHGPASSDFEQQALARDELERLRTQLSDMKPHYARAVFLHDVQGHELAEIAVMEGITVAAAQSRLVRGRRELYHRLGVQSGGRLRR